MFSEKIVCHSQNASIHCNFKTSPLHLSSIKYERGCLGVFVGVAQGVQI